MRVPWLADVLRDAGCKVWESPGWKGRGREMREVHGIVWHHTASSPRTSDTAVHALLRDGRRDLAGPLSQLGLERDGTFVVIADGRCNHNGYGEWGNDSIGIEAYNDGVGEPWPAAQLDAFHVGTAAIVAHHGMRAAQVKGHRETDPRRKIDPTGIDMGAARARIADILRAGAQPTAPTPAPSPTPATVHAPEEGPMFLLIQNVGLFAVVDGVPAPFKSLAEYAEAKEHSEGVPVLTLPEKQGRNVLERLLLKTAAASERSAA